MGLDATSGNVRDAMEAALAEGLAQADRALASTGPILRHLLCKNTGTVFSDETVARVRGMSRDVARQLASAVAEAAGASDAHAWGEEAAADLAEGLATQPALLSHFHALALEWQLAERLQASLGLDPVLNPLLQSEIASADPARSAAAMSLLAAQTRYAQTQRRMQLPVHELPADLLALALATLRAAFATSPGLDERVAAAAEQWRAQCEPARSRLAQLRAVIEGMGGSAADALSIERAGVALFLTALGLGAGIARESAVMATVEGQQARFVLALCACGLKPDAVLAQVLAVHPQGEVSADLALLRADDAAAILAGRRGPVDLA